jgi:hypothetical protein
MTEFEKCFCEMMSNFISSHINEIKKKFTFKYLGYKNKEDLIKSIKEDINHATWALTELCYWGMKHNYYNDIFYYDRFSENNFYKTVFKFNDNKRDRLFIINLDENYNTSITEVKPIKKYVEVIEYETC